jgi:2-oxoglutarate dehydrogenase E2 component (dihydrolipoamide succinyltransferase)
MAKVDVIMPQMGESIAEGTLTKWFKQVGAEVERDEDLFEISTDKVDADIPSPASGLLAEILVEEGDTVEVNTIVARIETEMGAAAATAQEAQPAPDEHALPAAAPVAEALETPEAPVEPAAPGPELLAPVEPPPPTQEPLATEAPAAAEALPAAASVAETPEAPAASPGEGTAPGSREERLRTRSTPLVRKIAAEHGVDIARIEGSGIAGRVTRDDILTFIDERGMQPAAAAPGAAEVPATAAPPPPAPGVPSTAAAPAGPAGVLHLPIHGATLEVKLARVPIREGDRVEDMSRVRLRTMEHMLMSQHVSAHVTSVTEIDFERVVKLRRKFKPRFEAEGVKLTYGPFIMRAIVEGLKAYPILNASVDGTRIVYHGDINLGIAVAIDDGSELIVPVLKNADRLSLMGLAEGANALAEKARTRTLDFDDIQGGTFTITNVGVFGNLFGTPIINQPQVAILGTGVIEKRPVIVKDDLGGDAIGIRNMSYFGLSYDHRVVDGAMAAFFLNKVQEVLETFPEDVV